MAELGRCQTTVGSGCLGSREGALEALHYVVISCPNGTAGSPTECRTATRNDEPLFRQGSVIPLLKPYRRCGVLEELIVLGSCSGLLFDASVPAIVPNRHQS